MRGDFQALGYPGSFSLNFSLRSALLLEEKERCEEVTEEMEHAKHAKKTSSQLRMERSSISRQTRASFLCRGQPDNDAAQWKRWKQHC